MKLWITHKQKDYPKHNCNSNHFGKYNYSSTLFEEQAYNKRQQENPKHMIYKSAKNVLESKV